MVGVGAELGGLLGVLLLSAEPPDVFHWVGGMNCMCVYYPNSCVETLTPSWMVSGGGAFGR